MRSAPLARPLEPGTEAADSDTFLRDVREDLHQTPRRLRPQYLYDDLGTSLFEAICRLPWYPITRAEKRLLASRRDEIARAVAGPLTLVELGCGTGEKLELLVDALLHGRGQGRAAASAGRRLTVRLVDVSGMALERSRRLLARRPGVEVACYECTYEDGLAAVACDWNGLDARLALFLGSNIGNFDPPDAVRFLLLVRATLARGDSLLIGVDLVKPPEVLKAAYDDPLGVTAAFNKNLLVRLNRELGADFDLAAFAHRATWNAGESRVEMHLVSLRDQVVRIPGADPVAFPAGETIWTESSYKFTTAQVRQMAEQAGFEVARTWIDPESQFALALLGVDE
jgi:L-histidine N-alpha-methyltransferase